MMMNMLVSDRLIKNGKFIEFIGELKDGRLIYGVMAADGLIYRFHRTDIQEVLNLHYPHDKYGWYFNTSHDRYIAELEDKDTISVNPRFVVDHFVNRIYS